MVTVRAQDGEVKQAAKNRPRGPGSQAARGSSTPWAPAAGHGGLSACRHSGGAPRVLSPTPSGGVRAKGGLPRAQAGNVSPAQRPKPGSGEERKPFKEKTDATRKISQKGGSKGYASAGSKTKGGLALWSGGDGRTGGGGGEP